MEAILFTPGPQIAGTEVIDQNGLHWRVLKDIANALAQPREGAYYTRVLAPVVPPVDYGEMIKKLGDSLSSQITELAKKVALISQPIVVAQDSLALNPKDFKMEDLNGVKTIRIIR